MIYDSDQHNTQNLSSMMDLFFRNLNGGNESGQKRFLRGAGSGDDDALRDPKQTMESRPHQTTHEEESNVSGASLTWHN
jgi:hypothetical protein